MKAQWVKSGFLKLGLSTKDHYKDEDQPQMGKNTGKSFHL